jgi:N-acetylglucosaminyldiphosphoundecaprenol N-acetyl-beta-D-mannosaminyltransferase
MSDQAPPKSKSDPIWIWGLPLAPVTAGQLLRGVEDLIGAREPSYFITANLNYAMLTDRNDDLREINRHAAYVVADGMPLVWASRWRGTPLPERVAGSDFLFMLCKMAAERGHRLFLLGGEPGVAELAMTRLRERYPALQVVGVESPPFRPLSAEEHEAMIERVRAARPEILLVAFCQPKGGRWIFANYRTLGVPICVQVGASLDFAAGKVNRAPRWLQIIGLEWAYRMALEPRRLAGRYLDNAVFMLRCCLGAAGSSTAESPGSGSADG